MSVKGTNFQVTFTIKTENTNDLVYYKQDGTRFDNENTIKMKVQTPYIFLLTIRPAQKIKVASMKGDHLKTSSEEITAEYSSYCFHWKSTDIPVTRNNRRLNFNLILEIHGVGILELPLQMKFYEATDTGHSKWGKSLHHVEFECMHKGRELFRRYTEDNISLMEQHLLLNLMLIYFQLYTVYKGKLYYLITFQENRFVKLDICLIVVIFHVFNNIIECIYLTGI